MGKGGGGGQDSFATPLAPWVEGAHRRLVGEAEAEAYGTPYQAYEGERVAGFTPEEQAGFASRQAMFEGGDPYADWAGQELQYGADLTRNLGDVSAQYGQRGFDFGRFGQAEAQQYMSPYMQNVTEFEKSAAREEFDRGDMQSDAERVSRGSRGGYRDALANYLGESERAETIGGIQARGQQSAFENAQQQFERDRGAMIQAARMGDASSVEASRQAMAADLSNQKRVFDQSKLAGDFAQKAMDFGTVGQARELQRIRAMEQAGATQREIQQQILNLQVEDFDRQQNYPWQQMGRLSQVIAGVHPNIGGTATSQAPASGPAQLLSLGLGLQGIQGLL